MAFFITKVFVSALLIAIVSQVAARSDKFGGMIAALPVATFLIIIWMYFDGASDEKIARHMSFTLFFVLPTLPIFLAFPFLIHKFGFPVAVVASIALTAILIYLFNLIYQQFGWRIL
jgi:F0F1-type ATP synthase assembly protein I